MHLLLTPLYLIRGKFFTILYIIPLDTLSSSGEFILLLFEVNLTPYSYLPHPSPQHIDLPPYEQATELLIATKFPSPII